MSNTKLRNLFSDSMNAYNFISNAECEITSIIR